MLSRKVDISLSFLPLDGTSSNRLKIGMLCRKVDISLLFPSLDGTSSNCLKVCCAAR